jgi:hypothetical protein
MAFEAQIISSETYGDIVSICKVFGCPTPTIELAREFAKAVREYTAAHKGSPALQLSKPEGT